MFSTSPPCFVLTLRKIDALPHVNVSLGKISVYGQRPRLPRLIGNPLVQTWAFSDSSVSPDLEIWKLLRHHMTTLTRVLGDIGSVKHVKEVRARLLERLTTTFCDTFVSTKSDYFRSILESLIPTFGFFLFPRIVMP